MKKTFFEIPTINKKKMVGKVLTLALVMLSFTPMFASGPLSGAATTISGYWDDVKGLIYAIGAIVGLIGGVRIYNKWTNGDQDINKEIVGWGGACLFLTLVPEFVDAFFL